VIYAHTHSVSALARSPDGRLIATGGDDSHPRIWNIDPGALQFEQLLPSAITSVAWAPYGSQLTASSATRSAVFDKTSNGAFNAGKSLPASAHASSNGGRFEGFPLVPVTATFTEE
jgi:WD40 repeat protein